MPNGYNSEFTGQHNDEYDDRITALESLIATQTTQITNLITTTTNLNKKLLHVGTAELDSNVAEDDKVIFIDRVPYSTIDSTHTDSIYWRELLKYICAHYPNRTNCVFISSQHPNSQGTALIQIYNTSLLQDGLPQYSNGCYMPLSSTTPIWQFGTSSYTYYFRGAKNYGFYKSSASSYNVTNTQIKYGSISITTTGRPVLIICSGDLNPTAATCWMNYWILRNGSAITHDIVESHGNSWNIPFCITYLDRVGAGTYTYSIDFQMGSNTANLAEGGALQSPDFSVFEI